VGKKAIDLIVDFLSCLWEYAKEQITREIGAVADLSKHYEAVQEKSHIETFLRTIQTLLMFG
jgi:hypothetical protein